MLSRRHLILLAPLGAAAACAGNLGTGGQPATSTGEATVAASTTSAPTPMTTSTAPTTPLTRTATPTKPPVSRAAPTLAALREELSALARRHGVDLGVAATEVHSRRSFTWGADVTIETASIAKADILATLLLQLQDRSARISSRQLAVASDMIGRSDHESAWTLFREVGLAEGMEAANKRFGLKVTQCFDYSWGLTRTTARDQLRLLTAISAAGSRSSPLTARSGAVLLDLMEDVIAEQKWGVSAAAHKGERVCLKNGWLPRSILGRRWIVNSIGRISSRSVDLRLAVLSQKTLSQQSGIAVVEEAASLTRRHLAV
jgi:hypothetical protein